MRERRAAPSLSHTSARDVRQAGARGCLGKQPELCLSLLREREGESVRTQLSSLAAPRGRAREMEFIVKVFVLYPTAADVPDPYIITFFNPYSPAHLYPYRSAPIVVSSFHSLMLFRKRGGHFGVDSAHCGQQRLLRLTRSENQGRVRKRFPSLSLSLVLQ